MRNKFFSRKLRAVLSVTLSIVMLIGTVLVVPTTAMAETAYLDSFGTFSKFSKTQSDSFPNTLVLGGSQTSGAAFYGNTLSFTVGKYSEPTNGYIWKHSWDHEDYMGVYLWSNPRYQRLFTLNEPLVAKAGATYSLSFKWLNPNPEVNGVPQNASVKEGDGYSKTASIKLVYGAGKFTGGTSKLGTELVTLLDRFDFSSEKGNKNEWVEKTVYFYVPAGSDINDLALELLNTSNTTAKGDNDKAVNESGILLDDITFAEVDDVTCINFENEIEYDGGSSITGIGKGGAKASKDGNTGGDKLITTENTSYVFATAFSSAYGGDEKFATIKRGSNKDALTSDALIALKAGKYTIEFDYLWYSVHNKAFTNEVFDIAVHDHPQNVYYRVDGTDVLRFCNAEILPEKTWGKASFEFTLDFDAKSFGFHVDNANKHIYIDNVVIKLMHSEKATFTNMDGSNIEVKYYGDVVTVPDIKENGLCVAWKDADGNLYKKGQQIDPAISADLIPVYIIDFEENTIDGSGYFKIKDIGENGESNNVFYANGNPTIDFKDKRYTQLKLGNDTVKLSKGYYEFEYSYFITENATALSSGKPVIKLAETNGLASPYDNGTYFGENLINFTDENKGKWIKETEIISIENDIAALGFYGYLIPREIRLDNIILKPVEIVNFVHSDNTIEVLKYEDGMKFPEGNALNFSHWVDSKGESVAIGDSVNKNETYTAVLNNKIVYDFSNFKETDAAKKTEEGIRVEVEPLTEKNVVVPIETDSGKKIVLNKNSGYLVRANYKSMSVAGEDGSGAAGYVAEWWNPENPISAKKGNFPEIRISISSVGYATGGIALQDTVDYVTTKWTYIETGNSEHSLKLSFSAKKANLSEVYVKSIEIVAFDLSATQADENVINTTVEMFYNGTNDDVTINTSNKNSNIFGLKMPAMSAVYNYKDTQRSLMRFVTNYAYADGDITQLKVSDELSLPIEKRRILVGKENSSTDDYGVIVTNDRKFTSSTPERLVKNDKSCWKIDTENGVISHSLMLKNIKKENKNNIYEIQSYLLLDVVDGRNYSSWLVLGGNFNYLRFVEPTAKVTAQNVYDGLSATANVAWYE